MTIRLCILELIPYTIHRMQTLRTKYPISCAKVCMYTLMCIWIVTKI